MQKKVILICFLLLLVGCKKVANSDNYIDSIRDCFNTKSVTNSVSLGYKYYIPKGVKKVRDYDYNQIFLIDESYVYLYVDIISYFYDRELKTTKEEDDYYYQTFNHDNNTGYIRIKQESTEKYLVNIVYHYSKIEVYATKQNLNKIIILSSIILNSIEYNDTVIEKILEGDLGQFSEFTYEVEKPEGASNNFSQYLEEYVQKEEEIEQLPDE